MAGLSIVFDLLKKNPCITSHCVNSYRQFLATNAATVASSSVAVAAPFATWAFCRKDFPDVAFCDAGQAFTVDYSSNIADLSGKIFQQNTLYDGAKDYNVALKPIFSAFHLRNFALTSLRSFLLFYLPLLEPHDDDDNLDPDKSEAQSPDLVEPFKKSVKQIARDVIVYRMFFEFLTFFFDTYNHRHAHYFSSSGLKSKISSVLTTRRVLERIVFHRVPQRMACKLLKDAPRSALRKAGRGMSPLQYTCSVSRTTCRAHCLGILASWIVQVGIDFYRHCGRVFVSSDDKEADETETVEQIRLLGWKIYGTSVRCGASLVFASVGAGIGALVIRPYAGQYIGCVMGDLAGPVIVSCCLDKLLLHG